ncbi:TMEM14 family protein [Thermoleptolyngbya sichuanensis XZ-Cy5]|uniref:TMEM14 family protein n=1 Tax=Thermoleptolyngbya sichuanensis TaxID=2885951 RepID=UPI00240D1428|nr:TMEM14 family protein [Thermoleptolyngbya sichuanensis]MDG2614677.1 TMEM14 family protein [Thermoleptolyngbya sichuanensis XZ-Cy5]
MVLTLSAIAAIAYGLLALVGGIIGYRQAGSQASLISGSISGALLLLSGILQAAGISWARGLGVLITGTLVVVFITRWIKTQKTMPALLMIMAGLASLLLMGLIAS